MLFLRYIAVASFAVVVALGLFLLMAYLIESKEGVVLDKYDPVDAIDFIRAKPESDMLLDEEQLPEKQELEEQPLPPELDMSQLESSAGPGSLEINAPTPDTPAPEVNIDKGFDMLGAPYDTDIIPLVRVQPVYPAVAAQQRIEGWVILEFTVTDLGTIRDPKVVEFFPSDIFNQSALQAITKWKYKPRIINGKRITCRGVQVKITFELDDI